MKVVSDRNGFTIVELIVVIVVIGILAGIVVFAYNGVQDRAYNAKILSAVSNWADAFELYMAKTGTMPSAPPTSSVGHACVGSVSSYPALSDMAAGVCRNVGGPAWTAADGSATMSDLTSAGIDLPSDVFDSDISGSTVNFLPVRGIAFFVRASPKDLQLIYTLKGANQQCLGNNTSSSTTGAPTTICIQELDTSAVTH